MHSLSPADELADLRADIAHLKLLEAALRAKILAAPDSHAIGRWHRIEVVKTKARVFDAKLLPAAIRDDPRFYRDRVTQVVRCLAIEVKRPGWPIQRDGGSDRHAGFH
jgi:hypothetical protein